MKGAILSDADILHEIIAGNVIVDPFNMSNLGTCSYDVRLGEYYFEEQKPQRDRLVPRLVPDIFNPYDEEHVQKVWGSAPKMAQSISDVFFGRELNGVADNDSIILLSPGETILAHTEEFIGGRVNITTKMQARSSMGRSFIEVCKCAGMGDVGYFNRWTMEITNNSRYYTIPLVVGRRIAQIVFYYTGPIRNVDYAANGKYQQEVTLSDIIASWTPMMMLPKLYRDREIVEPSTVRR